MEHEPKIPSPLDVGAHQPNQLSEISFSLSSDLKRCQRATFRFLLTCLPVSSAVHFGLWFSVSVCQRRATVRAFRERLPHQTGFVTLILVPAAAAATRARSLCKTERQIRRMARYITGIAFSSQHTELIIYIWLSVRRRRRRRYPFECPLVRSQTLRERP